MQTLIHSQWLKAYSAIMGEGQTRWNNLPSSSRDRVISILPICLHSLSTVGSIREHTSDTPSHSFITTMTTTTTTVEPTEPQQIAPESSVVTTPNNPSRNNRKAPLEQANSNPTDTNPLWKGYSWLAFTSVVCCASASNLKYYEGSTALCITFASVSFGISVIILLLDRFQGCFESFKFHKAYDGKLEGFSLLFLAMWWIIGVAILTSSGGAAYSALNIYFSSWLSLLATCYTLNCWSGSQDILTLQELTALSPTLRGWYCLLFSSLVVMGSGVGMHLHLDEDGPKAQASFAISAGLISMIVAAILILSYYRILSFIAVGGFVELGITCILFLLWIVR